MGRKIPQQSFGGENPYIEGTEFDLYNQEINYPEDLEFDFSKEEKLLDYLFWTQPRNYRGGGNCDDFSVFIHESLEQKGHSSICVSGILEAKEIISESSREPAGETATKVHMWTEAEMSGSYYRFDVNHPYTFKDRDGYTEIWNGAPEEGDVAEVKYKPILMFGKDREVTLYNPRF